MGKIYQVVVYGLRGQKTVIDLCNTEEQMKSMTVLQLKEKIAEKLPETAGQEVVGLVCTGKLLHRDTDLLSGYGIQHMSIIHVVVEAPWGVMA